MSPKRWQILGATGGPARVRPKNRQGRRLEVGHEHEHANGPCNRDGAKHSSAKPFSPPRRFLLRSANSSGAGPFTPINNATKNPFSTTVEAVAEGAPGDAAAATSLSLPHSSRQILRTPSPSHESPSKNPSDPKPRTRPQSRTTDQL